MEEKGPSCKGEGGLCLSLFIRATINEVMAQFGGLECNPRGNHFKNGNQSLGTFDSGLPMSHSLLFLLSVVFPPELTEDGALSVMYFSCLGKKRRYGWYVGLFLLS